MEHNYAQELEHLKTNDNIEKDSKLMIFSIYYELCNAVEGTDILFGDEIIDHYLEHLSSIFLLTCYSVNSEDPKLQTKSFYKTFFKMFNPTPRVLEMENLLNEYGNNIDQVILGMGHIVNIDKLDLDLIYKSELIITFREHVNHIYDVMYEVFGMSGYLNKGLKVSSYVANRLITYSVDSFDNFMNDIRTETKTIINQTISVSKLNQESQELLKTLYVEDNGFNKKL